MMNPKPLFPEFEPKARPHVYLASPIDRAISSSLRAKARGTLNSRMVVTYDPSSAWWGASPPFHPSIQQVNDEAIRRAGAVLAVVPDDMQSVGVPIEIERALHLGVPVVVLAEILQSDSPVWAALTDPGDQFVWCQEVNTAVDLVVDHLSLAMEAPRARALYRMGAGGHPPRPGFDGDAGVDLHCSEGLLIRPGQSFKIATSIGVQLPEGFWCLVHGRSSSWKKGLLINTSVIDAGFRGDLFVEGANISDESVVVEPGDRLAQILPLPVPPAMSWSRREHLDDSDRGADGYGSSGR